METPDYFTLQVNHVHVLEAYFIIMAFFTEIFVVRIKVHLHIPSTSPFFTPFN